MSFQNILVKEFLRLVRKPMYASEQILSQNVARARETVKSAPPPKVQQACQIEKGSWEGMPYYTVRPLHGKGANGHLLYLHGGGYHFDLVSQHWQLVSELVNRSDVTATIPLYPLAPEHTYRDAYPRMITLYQHLCDTYHAENLSIEGDSAGGGMALSLVQQAVAQGLPHPKQILLTSPWLDMTIQNPVIRQRDRIDPVFNSVGLLAAARWWAGGDDLASPALSPTNGSLAGIGSLLMVVGTDESLLADARIFRDRALAEGVDLEYIEKEGLAHLFIYMPIPEAKPVIDRFVERLRRSAVKTS